MGICDMFNLDGLNSEEFNFIGYRSPIELITSELNAKIENDTVTVCQNYGFNVDKEELKRALEYDRGQYDKGYHDGYVRGREELIKCKNCKYYLEDVVREIIGVPVIVGHTACTKWGDGYMKTEPEGYCFLAEKRETNEDTENDD